MWKKLTLTTASNTSKISFKGRGSIYAEGTFGGGTVRAHLVYYSVDGAAPAVSTGFIDSAIDGTIIKSIDCPSGDYQLNLNGSVGATVDVYYNGQVELSIDS